MKSTTSFCLDRKRFHTAGVCDTLTISLHYRLLRQHTYRHTGIQTLAEHSTTAIDTMWYCDACSLRNKKRNRVCEVCDTPRPGTLQLPAVRRAGSDEGRALFNAAMPGPSQVIHVHHYHAPATMQQQLYIPDALPVTSFPGAPSFVSPTPALTNVSVTLMDTRLVSNLNRVTREYAFRIAVGSIWDAVSYASFSELRHRLLQFACGRCQFPSAQGFDRMRNYSTNESNVRQRGLDLVAYLRGLLNSSGAGGLVGSGELHKALRFSQRSSIAAALCSVARHRQQQIVVPVADDVACFESCDAGHQ